MVPSPQRPEGSHLSTRHHPKKKKNQLKRKNAFGITKTRFYPIWDKTEMKECMHQAIALQYWSTMPISHTKKQNKHQKIILLQNTVQYHEARDWIRQQNQQELTFTSLLTPCTLLVSWCKQYQKTKENDMPNSLQSQLIHTPTHTKLNTQNRCTRCGYTHPRNNCPAFWQGML